MSCSTSKKPCPYATFFLGEDELYAYVVKKPFDLLPAPPRKQRTFGKGEKEIGSDEGRAVDQVAMK